MNRTGIRRYNANLFRIIRPDSGPIRRINTGAWTNLITDLNDTRRDHFSGAFFEVENNPGDELELNYERAYVDVQESFDIAGVLAVPVGIYRWEEYSVSAETTSSRRISAGLGVSWGGRYGGDLMRISSNIRVRPSKHFELAAEHRYLDFDLPSGQIGIHVASVNSTIAFTPDMAINTEVQYDNISESFTFFSRFRWEPTPEREIFLSFGHTALIERETFPDEFRSLGSSLALRLGHTFRM